MPPSFTPAPDSIYEVVLDVPTTAPTVVATESAKTALPIPSTFPSLSTLPVRLATDVSVPAVSKKSTKRKANATPINPAVANKLKSMEKACTAGGTDPTTPSIALTPVIHAIRLTAKIPMIIEPGIPLLSNIAIIPKPTAANITGIDATSPSVTRVAGRPATLVTLGDVASMPVMLAAVGFGIMAILDKRGIPGSIIIGILAVSLIAWITGVSAIDGVVGSVPPAVHAFSMDFSLLATAGFIGVAFAFLFVDFFDTAGTLTSVANLTGKVDKEGNVDGIGKAVLADSVATTVGAVVGTSNTTSYIESGAGVKEGGKTGLTAVTVAALFAICLFLAPLAQSIPAFATAPALVFVATFFLKNLRDIEWDDVTEYAPAVLAAILMPLTFSIAHGIALGFIAYVIIKALSGRQSDLNAGSIVIGVLSFLYYIFL